MRSTACASWPGSFVSGAAACRRTNSPRRTAGWQANGWVAGKRLGQVSRRGSALTASAISSIRIRVASNIRPSDRPPRCRGVDRIDRGQDAGVSARDPTDANALVTGEELLHGLSTPTAGHRGQLATGMEIHTKGDVGPILFGACIGPGHDPFRLVIGYVTARTISPTHWPCGSAAARPGAAGGSAASAWDRTGDQRDWIAPSTARSDPPDFSRTRRAPTHLQRRRHERIPRLSWPLSPLGGRGDGPARRWRPGEEAPSR